jgi:capsular polysaccharide biosynthesis protein
MQSTIRGMRLVFAAPGPDDIIHWLRSWRFWVLGAVLGALVGAAAFYVSPPPYRARATVNVDFHMEQAWPQSTDREQFYYLERETRKLQEIAVSDAVLSEVVSQLPGVSVEQMRSGKVQLSQPGNGGWHFFATDHDSKQAAALASAWASSFAQQVQKQVKAASTSGLEPFITADASQTQNLASHREVSLGFYLLAGAVLSLTLVSLGILFFHHSS